MLAIFDHFGLLTHTLPPVRLPLTTECSVCTAFCLGGGGSCQFWLKAGKKFATPLLWPFPDRFAPEMWVPRPSKSLCVWGVIAPPPRIPPSTRCPPLICWKKKGFQGTTLINIVRGNVNVRIFFKNQRMLEKFGLSGSQIDKYGQGYVCCL